MNNIDIPVALQEALTNGYDDIILFAEVLLGMQLHEGQKEFLRNANEKVNNLVPANRWGKSVVCAIRHIHRQFYKIGISRGHTESFTTSIYRTANLSPHSDSTKPVFDAIRQIMTSSFPIPQLDGSLKNNKCWLEWWFDDKRTRSSVPYYLGFHNSGEILFRSTGEDQGSSIQGKPFGYISYDEGGRSNHLEAELDSNILPRLADLNGTLDLVSTPYSDSNSLLYHFELFEKGKEHDPGYYSQEGSVEENVFLLRANPTYLESETARLRGNPIADQILHGKFIFAGVTLYPADQILQAMTDDLTAGERYKKGHQYVISVDTAMGDDERVYTVLDDTKVIKRTVRQNAMKGSQQSIEFHVNDFIDLCEAYMDTVDDNKSNRNISIIIETFNGESALFYKMLPEFLKEVTVCWGTWQPPGLPGNVATLRRRIKKEEVLLSLGKALANHQILLPNIPPLKKQLSVYRQDDKKLKTDRVISLALGVWKCTDGKPALSTIEVIPVEDW